MPMPPTPWVSFRAAGTPIPQGSKRVWVKDGKPMMAEDQGDRHASWRREVTAAATEAMWRAEIKEPSGDPLSVLLTFFFTRGLGQYGTGKNAQTVKATAPAYPHKPPDLDKLVRAVFDAITDARLWVDDGQVVSFTARKRFIDRYGNEPEGVEVAIGRFLES